MSCIVSNDFAEIKEWMIIKGLAKHSAECMCMIEGCGVYIKEYYGWCEDCENFSICDKQDKTHEDALIYQEGCKDKHFEIFSACLPCASKKSEFNKCGCPMWYVDIFHKYEIYKKN